MEEASFRSNDTLLSLIGEDLTVQKEKPRRSGLASATINVTGRFFHAFIESEPR
jgi:hypothetical protein